MPQMCGDEASKIINQLIQDANHASDSIPIQCNIVACTANTTENWKKQALESGMVDIVNKPLNPIKVKTILEKWYYN